MDQKPIPAEPQKPRRRWFQFTLRTLLAGMALLSVLFAAIAVVVRLSEHRPNYASITVGSRIVEYAVDGEEADIAYDPGIVEIRFKPQHRLRVESGRVVLDGSEICKLPPGTTKVRVETVSGFLDVSISGKMVAEQEIN